MLNLTIDAVETAKSIHDGDYSSLRGKSFVIRVNMKKRATHLGDKPVDKPIEKVTLKQVVNMMNDGFKRLNDKMDAGFKQVNSRIDNIEKRLDYNNLKDLPH